MTSSRFLPYGRQNIDEDDIQAVVEALQADFLTTGPTIAKFENALCDVTGAKYAIACSNGTTALHLACLAIDLKEGDYAIIPSVTFLATANAVRYCGADVIFCDVDPDTGLMTEQTFQAALDEAKKDNKTVRAVLPVHLGGRPVDLAAIKNIASKENIHIIADSCHAIGGGYNEKPIGACEYEDMAAFSFHPVKTIATGEGGAITTNDKAMADRMRLLRTHGMNRNDDMQMWEYEMAELGYNYRITDIQCALGISQLKKIEAFVSKRQQLVTLYNDLLTNVSPHIRAHHIDNSAHKISWHLYAARFDFDALGISRQSMMERLKEKDIGSQVHYIPVHSQPYYIDLYGEKSLPGTEQYYTQTLSLPLYPGLSEDDVHYIVDTLKTIVSEA